MKATVSLEVLLKLLNYYCSAHSVESNYQAEIERKVRSRENLEKFGFLPSVRYELSLFITAIFFKI